MLTSDFGLEDYIAVTAIRAKVCCPDMWYQYKHCLSCFCVRIAHFDYMTGLISITITATFARDHLRILAPRDIVTIFIIITAAAKKHSMAILDWVAHHTWGELHLVCCSSRAYFPSSN